MKFNYNVTYNKPVDAEWVSRQFKIYDQYVKEYYDPRELLNNFDGTSWDKDGFKEYNISKLGDVEKLSVIGRSLFGSDVTMNDDLTVNDVLTVKGHSNLKSVKIENLTVSKDTNIGENTTIGGDLRVVGVSNLTIVDITGNETVGGDLNVGNKLLAYTLNVSKDANIVRNATIGGKASAVSLNIDGTDWKLCKDDAIAELI